MQLNLHDVRRSTYNHRFHCVISRARKVRLLLRLGELRRRDNRERTVHTPNDTGKLAAVQECGFDGGGLDTNAREVHPATQVPDPHNGLGDGVGAAAQGVLRPRYRFFSTDC